MWNQDNLGINHPQVLGAVLDPDPSTSYLLSRHLNGLDFDAANPKDPKTLGNYIKKWRIDKGLFQVDLAKKIGVDEITVVNWEIKGIVPRITGVRERLMRVVQGTARFL